MAERNRNIRDKYIFYSNVQESKSSVHGNVYIVRRNVHTSLLLGPGHEDPVDPASQDLFGPECPVHSAELQPDCDSETPELLPSVPFQWSADTLRPQERPLERPLEGLQERPLEALPHVGFLQAFCALHRVREDDRGLEPLWFHPDGEAGSLLEESVCQLLASLVKACRDPPPLGPGDLGLQACRAVAQATDLVCSQRPPSAEFRRRVESTLEELTEMLLQHDVFSQVSDPMGGFSPLRGSYGGLALRGSSPVSESDGGEVEALAP